LRRKGKAAPGLRRYDDAATQLLGARRARREAELGVDEAFCSRTTG
jgi:hypothetical protein